MEKLRGLEEFLENREQMLGAMPGQREPLGAPAATGASRRTGGQAVPEDMPASGAVGKQWTQTGECGEAVGTFSSQ